MIQCATCNYNINGINGRWCSLYGKRTQWLGEMECAAYSIKASLRKT